MTTTDELLRETFAVEAATITMQPDARVRVGRLARHYRARRVAAITGAAVAAATVAIAAPTVMDSFGTTTLDGPAAASRAPYESWSPRGGLGTDSSFAASAVAAWDAATPADAPHTDVRVLWADVFATGRAAVLLGTDGDGDRQLAVVAGGSPSMKVIRDVPAPDDLTHLSFNLFTDDEEHSAASYRDTLVVVTPPASGWTVEWFGGADPSEGTGTVTTDDGIAVIDISQSGPQGHPTIRLLEGSALLYYGPIGSLS